MTYSCKGEQVVCNLPSILQNNVYLQDRRIFVYIFRQMYLFDGLLLFSAKGASGCSQMKTIP